MRGLSLGISVSALTALLGVPASGQVQLKLLGTYESGIYNSSGDDSLNGTEVVAYDAKSKRLFSTHNKNNAIDVIDISQNPSTPTLLFSISLSRHGAHPNSVDAKNGVIAVAVESAVKTDPGTVAFFDATGNFLSSVKVGSQPDMLVFTPDGKNVLVANEAEPNDECTVDPEGSISIIDVSGGAAGVTQANVRTADFRGFTRADIDPKIRILSSTATVAQDLEPEYIAVSPDSKTAYVTLQENNAIAAVDIDSATVTRIMALGFKDHSLPGNGLDGSDRDGGINIQNWPVLGMYEPDAIAAYQAGGKTFLVTANEGDVREWTGCNEQTSVSRLKLDPTAFPNADFLKQRNNIGNLRVTKLNGLNPDGTYGKLYAFGARSFSIWTDQGQQVFDSGDEFERVTAAAFPDFFNASHTKNFTFDSRSTSKGPEPEGVAVGRVGGRDYAFVCFERIGGLMVYDISEPAKARFVQYLNNRNFYGSPKAGTAGDLGPEIVRFIPDTDSPNGKPLLAVANEVSGTVSVYEIR